MNSRYDVLIVGAGLVGASFALALRDSDLSVALVDAAPAPACGEGWDRRIYALNPASIDFLSRLGVWRQLAPERIQSVEAMRIYGDGGAELSFDAYETGVAALAHIVEANRLQHALWQAVQACDNLRLFHPRRGARFERDSGIVRVMLDDDTVLEASLIVGADGATSWVREAAGIEARSESYGARGVVANFECELPHQGAAHQWFTPDGVLAYLPLPGARMSMVWSAPETLAETLVAMAPEELGARVAEAGRHRLGALKAFGPAAAFPLHRLTVPRTVDAGVALIGDAAHVVHPLAGQGVNLGFADADTLAACLLAREPFKNCGDLSVLRRYARVRAEPIRSMSFMTHGLQRLFETQSPALRGVRNLGLDWVERLTPLKTLLVRHALG